MNSRNQQSHAFGSGVSRLSCFLRWSFHEKEPRFESDLKSMKIEARCKECGKTYVKYACRKTSRCESCRERIRREAQKENECIEPPG